MGTSALIVVQDVHRLQARRAPLAPPYRCAQFRLDVTDRWV